MTAKAIALGVSACGVVGFLGYCIYFDRKRRSAPDFKKKLHERRQQAKQQKTEDEADGSLPNMTDPAAMQEYFMKQVTKGEEALAAGDAEKCVNHLLQAIRVSGNPTQLLQMFQGALPQPVFKLLMQRLPTVLSGPPRESEKQAADEDVD
ncbi:mitochondrial import receptor subunit TOM20 homolog isoform X2 [Oscarella lobularis]|uniref:mitochondrial import receptor subunit TOM20 homolog isoform X2 n=1 Tax=Oscarella lobularis TaxID=121494 RepID=UPI00331412CB